MGVPIEPGTDFAPGIPAVVAQGAIAAPANVAGRHYDVSRDGRLLVITERNPLEESSSAPALIVVQNWFEELTERVPTP